MNENIIQEYLYVKIEIWMSLLLLNNYFVMCIERVLFLIHSVFDFDEGLKSIGVGCCKLSLKVLIDSLLKFLVVFK